MLFDLVDLRTAAPLRCGGRARVCYPTEPEHWHELAGRAKYAHGLPVFGALSNTVPAEQPEPFVSTKRWQGWERISDREWWVRSGTMLPTFAMAMAKEGMGGIAWMMSIPGTIGGAVVMNAGRGSHLPKQCMASIVTAADCMTYNGKPAMLNREALAFRYRTSALQWLPLWVLRVRVRLVPMPPECAMAEIKQRMAYVRQRQERGKPNVGSVFKQSHIATQEFRGWAEGGMSFSKQSLNWIVNNGTSTPQDFRRLVERVFAEHEQRGLPPPVPEVHFM